ncbi:hypothetical protein OAG63_01780 [Methylacidiphilales bacterium]|nr:hypothetical protein [Candidatus Methylacidiphilales bacterium]
MKNIKLWNLAACFVFISALAGCKREDATVYNVPKDDSSPAQPTPQAMPEPPATQPEMGAPTPDTAISLPQLKYQLPAGWQEKTPSEMRVASFTALGPNGQSADVGVIPLPVIGRDSELVNMWRSQVQLPPTTDPNAVNQFKPVTIGSEQGRLFEFVSDQPMIGKSRQRVLIAMLTRGTMSWFFKITGEDAFVTSQKDKFLRLLKSVSFADDASAQMTAAPTAPVENVNTASIWTVPPDWQSVPPSQFLLA